MKKLWLGIAALAVTAATFAGEDASTRPSADIVTGAWKLEKIVYSSGAVETQGGFIFLNGYYSTTVNYSRQGTQTNISQFGTYSLEGNRLVLVPSVHVSTRAQTVIYEAEPPFTLEITLTGDEMRGTAQKDGTTFVFRRLR
ncbi:MAG TPA: hypothetical protein VGR38_12125 [Candidatus Polarisedimenticolia bacterium]|nr:hypothetical protein [Candidatus Polarisedimenticolia bacterium]